jgi:hypothetical protein
MNRIVQENLAGKSQSSRYDAGYECELPSDVLNELVGPKRPPIPPIKTRPLSVPKLQSKGPLYLALVVAVAIIGGVATTLWRQPAAERARDHKTISQPLTPQPPPTPGPTVSPRATIPPAARATLVQRAPRATLVKPPAPRAQLVSDLPPPVQGQQYLATMPYDNLEVLATFRGWLPSQDDLPSHRNAIGDMFVINGVPFVWLFAPGATHADWIDP